MKLTKNELAFLSVGTENTVSRVMYAILADY